MFSKLQIWCEAIMEVVWLAAAITIPFFFNASSAQSFEPDKVFVLRFLAIIAGAAWLLKRLILDRPLKPTTSGKTSSGSLLRHPLAKLLLALIVIYTLSSVFSILPAISWLGLYSRAQGAVTFYSYAILFLIIFTELRNSAQLRRLQYAFVLTSLPVAGYGILQHFSLDSLPWINAMPGRSTGTMGNPIFLGAYLAIVIPLTFGCFAQAIRMLRGDSNRKPGLVRACICGLALVLQGLALFYTQSRGPVIGLVVSGYLCLFLFLILHRASAKDRFLFPALAAGLGILAPVFVIAAMRVASGFGSRAGTIGSVAAVVCLGLVYWLIWRKAWGKNWLWVTWLAQTVVLLLIFSAVPISTIEKTIGSTALDRLARLSGASVEVRRYLWQAGFQTIKSGSPPAMPGDSGDPFRHFRRIIGYGPENVWYPANRYASSELVRLHTAETVDRMHNETYDNLITLGFAGGILWLGIIVASFYYALKLSGFPAGGGWRDPCIFLPVIGGIAGVLWPWAAGHPYLMGVGVIAGLLAGVAAFAVWSRYRNRPSGFVPDDGQLFALCILGAIIAYLVETSVGIPVTSTRTYIFILLALLSVFSIRDLNRDEEPAKKRTSKHAGRWKNPRLFFAALSSFIVVMLCWCFIINSSNENSTWMLFLQAWFTGFPGVKPGLSVPESLILLLLILGGSIGWMYGEKAGLQTKAFPFSGTVLRALAIMLAVWFVMAVLSAAFWTASPGASPLKTSMDAEARVLFFFVALWLLVAAAAWRLTSSDDMRSSARSMNARSALAGAFVVLFALIAIHQWVLRPARADVAYRMARAYEGAGDLSAAIGLYDRATRLTPGTARYWISMGIAQASAAAADPARMQESLRSLQNAVDLNPLDPAANRTLAAILMQDAERSADPETRNRQLQKAISLYQRAAHLAPNYPDAYCDLGRCYFLLGDHQKAASLYAQSLQINRYHARTHMFLGEMHYRQKDVERAYKDFALAYKLDRGNPDAMRNLGFLLTVLNRKEEAIQMYLKALSRAPRDLASLRRLSSLYFSVGDSDAGHQYARRSYDQTPAGNKGTYEQYVAGLQNP
ncbi:MAG: tetratricopeptide repeat protein [Acidobacteria bacterium]|nr:tetratricopeptide repeat protein [Acidobacteriota bacterium]